MKAFFLGLLAAAWLAALPAAAKPDLFDSDAPLKLVITGPLKTLLREAPTSMNTYPATLSVAVGDAAPQTLQIQLRPRGLSRRTDGFCSFPPILLDFRNTDVKGTVFHGEKKVKLVTYCKNEDDYEQRVVLEHLIYKLYNLITPLSLRVRAAEVTYRNGDDDPGTTRFGYLIEPIGDLADRNDREVLNVASGSVSVAQLDPQATGRAALLEYMIGNLDWEFLASAPGQECCHNIRLLGAPGATAATASAVVPIPYDYDWSGFVDSPYAGPPEAIPVDSLQERYYRGFCASTAEMPAVIGEFRAHQADMLAIINNEPRLNAHFRDKTVRFMNGFFSGLSDPGHVEHDIIKHCR